MWWAQDANFLVQLSHFYPPSYLGSHFLFPQSNSMFSLLSPVPWKEPYILYYLVLDAALAWHMKGSQQLAPQLLGFSKGAFQSPC